MNVSIEPTSMPQIPPKSTLWEGFKLMIRVAWPLMIVVCLVLLGMWWELQHIDRYVQDVNRQWQVQIDKYYCMQRDQFNVGLQSAIGNFTANVVGYDDRRACLKECYEVQK